MLAHAADVINVLVWAVGLLGAGLVGILWWGFHALLERLADQDDALREIRMVVESELRELREMHHALDVRLTKIEVALNQTGAD